MLNSFLEAFSRNGYDTILNTPFSGGHIVKYYSSFPNVEALQIEILYTTYLKDEGLDSGTIPQIDEETFHSEKERLRLIFSEIFPQLCKQE